MRGTMKSIVIIVILMAIVALSGCITSINGIKPEESLPAQDILNIAYGNNKAQTMDVYLPKNRNVDTKVIGVIHGGGWLAGDKNDFTYFSKLLRDSGFAVANMNYRLAGTDEKFIFPAPIDDLQAAINYVSNHSSEWNVSNNIGLLGHSAGGQLALLYSYKYNDGKVKAVVSLAGPSDLTDDKFLKIKGVSDAIKIFLGGTLQDLPEKWKEASPINYVTNKTIPTLLFQGKADEYVPYEETQRLFASLQNKKVPSQLFLYDKANHSFEGANLLQIKSETEKWFRTYIQ